jgi:hypothetical protein
VGADTAAGFVPRRSLWELDHKIPLIDGGTHDLSNLQTLCAPCHRKKSAREHSERALRTRQPERGASRGDGAGYADQGLPDEELESGDGGSLE